MKKYTLWILVFLLLNGCSESRLNQKKKHFVHLGNIAFKEKLFDQAIRYYQNALELDPTYAQAYNNLGIVYAKTIKFPEAVQAFDQCITNDVNFIDAYFNRNMANYEIGNFYRSLDDLRFIENKYEPLSAIHFSKGLAFFGLKKYDSADFYFQKAVELDPENIETYVNLATSKVYRKQYDSARLIIDKALQIDSKSSDALNVLGMIYSQEGNYEKAIQCFNDGLTFKSNDAYLLNNRGYAYLMTDQLDLSLCDINESIVINPDNPWAYRNKGIYYYLKEDYDNAERLLLQCLKRDDSISLSHAYLGNVYLKKGELSEACFEYQVSKEKGEKEGEKAYQQYCQ